jgi:hypothetical protein
MNNSEEFSEDILSGYINPKKIEKAPEGFSDRVMTRIQTEKSPFVAARSSSRNYLIPLFSGIITIILIVSAIFLSSTENSASYLLLKPLRDIRITLPEISFEKLSGFNLPELMIYISIGIFMLLIFDRILDVFFHRERK